MLKTAERISEVYHYTLYRLYWMISKQRQGKEKIDYIIRAQHHMKIWFRLYTRRMWGQP